MKTENLAFEADENGVVPVDLWYRLVDGAYIVSGRQGLAWGCMALHPDLDAAVAEIRDEQLPVLAQRNHRLTKLPPIDIRLHELPSPQGDRQ